MIEYTFRGKKQRWNYKNGLIYKAVKKWAKDNVVLLGTLGTILGVFCFYILGAAMFSM